MRALRFIVNVSSGGRQGAALLARLRAEVGAERAVEFAPRQLDAEIARCHAEGAAAVACGGDGTVAALLEASWRVGGAVPVGVIPLGTGNDLARALGWHAVGSPLERLREAGERHIDRWTFSGPAGGSGPAVGSDPSAAATPRAWFNYLSFGYDARVVGRFHAMRRHHPRLFRGATLNKALYGMSSLADRGAPLDGGIALDGAPPLPPWSAALVLASIPSYAGGIRLGPAIAADDGRLDAFALPAGLALGLALGGMRAPRRLGAHRHLVLRLARPLSAQIDGEPLVVQAGRYEVAHGGSVAVLAPS